MNRPSRLAALVPGPAAGLDQPFEMLHACHERIERSLQLLQRLRVHVAQHGANAQARQAARDVLRYFDLAAPQHHLDEERHVLPALAASGDAQLAALGERLRQDHRAMEAAWSAARPLLLALAEGALGHFDAAQEQLLAGFAALHAGHLQAEEQAAFPAATARLDAAALRSMSQDMARRRGVA